MSPASNLEPVFETREHADPAFRNRDHVFSAHADQPGIIQPRLDRQHLADFEDRFLEARMLSNFQAEPVTGAVKKTGLSGNRGARPGFESVSSAAKSLVSAAER